MLDFLLATFVVLSSIMSLLCIFQIKALRKEIDKRDAINTPMMPTPSNASPPPTIIHPVASRTIEVDNELSLKSTIDPVVRERKHNVIASAGKKIYQKIYEKILQCKKGIARCARWMGVVILACVGAIFIKYLFDLGLMTPRVWIASSAFVGLGLCCFSSYLNSDLQSKALKYARIILSGVGITLLYVASVAAAHVYHLIPANLGFVALILITILAFVLAMRQGILSASLGLIGGILAPAILIDPPIAFVFSYLYSVLAGIIFLIAKKDLWILAIPAVLGAIGWVGLWLGTAFVPEDSLVLGLFLMAMSATIIFVKKYALNVNNKNEGALSTTINYLILVSTVFLMGLITVHAGFSWMGWALFGVLSIGYVGLALLDSQSYAFAPGFSILIQMMMMGMWQTNPQDFALVSGLFSVFYLMSVYLLQWRNKTPIHWVELTAATSLGYYLIGCFKLYNTSFAANIPLFWGGLALVLSGLSFVALYVAKIRMDYEKPQVLSIYTGTAIAFLSIGLGFVLPHEYFALACSVGFCAMAWINTKVVMNLLTKIMSLLVMGFLAFSALNFMMIIELIVFSLFPLMAPTPPIIDLSLLVLQIGLPAILFMMGCYLYQPESLKYLQRGLMVLVVFLSYGLIRYGFHHEASTMGVTLAAFFERGMITNMIFFYSLMSFWMGRRYQALVWSGSVLASIALFRVVYFDVLLYNPLWSLQAVGTTPIMNSLLLSYGLSSVWMGLLGRELSRIGQGQWAKASYTGILLLSFIFISLNIRQVFHGMYLNDSAMSYAETYSYSVAWFILSVSLLLFSIIREKLMLRSPSFALLVITVGKIFLFDASQLEGLLRMGVAVGFGLSLLGLGWIYTRFLMTTELADPVDPADPVDALLM